jgi:molybdate-binding protein/DNA-binding transcriptional regulator YhcF (GntR family)
MSPTQSFVYLEIAESIRRLIVSGRLGPGDKLPSVRDMARTWRCTPNTVGRAYALLADEGLISSHRGGGTRVSFGESGLDTEGVPAWRWASLVNRAEQYLLEAVSLGQTPAHAEAALAAAISRWEDMQTQAGRQRTAAAASAGAGEVAGRPPEGAAPAPAVVRFAGSHDLSVELLGRMVSEASEPVQLSLEFLGSLGGLIALARGETDIAGSHLWDEATGQYNLPFVQRVLPNRRLVLLTLVRRLIGLMVPSGNPERLHEVADVARPGIRLVNRQQGSGTRVWLDVQLKAACIDPSTIAGYDREETTHLAVARAIVEGEATVGVGIGAAAAAYGLGFVPLGQEQYDLVIPEDIWGRREVRALRAVVESDHFKTAVEALGGYESTATGQVVHIG